MHKPPSGRNLEAVPPELADETKWYTEHRTLLFTTGKWAVLGAVAGICVGFATRLFLWVLELSFNLTKRLEGLGGLKIRYYFFLPMAMPACVWLIRNFAPAAKGHGTEQVIAAVHQRSGKMDWIIAPIKLIATILTLAFGGSVGKEGPCAQIGAAVTSAFADLMRLNNKDRRKLVICGIGAGFAAVFGAPVSGALFGIEVLYVGRLEYPVLFPCLIAGIIAHLVCGAHAPVPVLHDSFLEFGRVSLVLWSLLFGLIFGLAALLLIETMRGMEKALRTFKRYPYIVAAAGGAVLAAIYAIAGESYAGLGTETIESSLSGATHVMLFAFVIKTITTSLTLEAGGSGGIVTALFFIGATAGAAIAHLFHLPEGLFASFGLVAVLAAAANTPIAAAVMGMELLPTQIGVYAALAACTAFLIVGHRSVYASQKLGFSKSSGWIET